MKPAQALGRAPSAQLQQFRTGPPGKHLVDVTLFFAPTSGGVRRYLLAKQQWLRSHARFKHTIVVPGRRDAGLPYDVVSLASRRIPMSGGYRLPLRMRALRELLSRLTPDLIEAGDPYHFAWQALHVARSRRIPTIAFCHSDLIALGGSVLGSFGHRAAAHYLSRLYCGFDLVLAPSATVAERLLRAGLRNVEIQPLGVDTTVLSPDLRDPSLRILLGIPARARLLVFAGRLSAEKRIADLLAVARLLGPRYHLLLVGGRRTGPLSSNASLLEYQQEPRHLGRILASCDACVHAGDQETFGLVALEAMACGLPVVAARAGALVELVDESVGATFQARNPQDCALAIERVFERNRAALGRAARQRAECHSWDSAFIRLLGRYARLLSPGNAGRGARRAG